MNKNLVLRFGEYLSTTYKENRLDGSLLPLFMLLVGSGINDPQKNMLPIYGIITYRSTGTVPVSPVQVQVSAIIGPIALIPESGGLYVCTVPWT
jgi:hypothetical protein